MRYVLILLSSTLFAGSFQVMEEAAYAGGYGLRLSLVGSGAAFVEDGTPDGETRYRVRVYLNLDNLTLPNNNGIDILGGYDLLSNSVFRISVSAQKGRLYLNAYARLDDETEVGLSNPIPALVGYHALEVDFSAGANGYLSLWLDDQPQESLVGLDNGTRVVELMRLGLNSEVPEGASGFLYLDECITTEGEAVGTCHSDLSWYRSLAVWGLESNIVDLLAGLENLCVPMP